ncbi:hypothetical protein D3C78_936370 [compost metagenome]
MQCLLELRVAFRTKRNGAVIGCIGMNISNQRRNIVFQVAGIVLECDVDFADIRNIAHLGRQVMPHEGIKVLGISRLAEGFFHGAPIAFIQLRLQRRLQPHENVVADQVRLTEFQAGGVHAFENQLRIILATIKGDFDDDQLREPFTDRNQFGTILAQQGLEKMKVLLDACTALSRHWRLLEDCQQRFLVGFRKNQLEVTVTVLIRVEQIVIAQLPGRERLQQLIKRRQLISRKTLDMTG